MGLVELTCSATNPDLLNLISLPHLFLLARAREISAAEGISTIFLLPLSMCKKQVLQVQSSYSFFVGPSLLLWV